MQPFNNGLGMETVIEHGYGTDRHGHGARNFFTGIGMDTIIEHGYDTNMDMGHGNCYGDKIRKYV